MFLKASHDYELISKGELFNLLLIYQDVFDNQNYNKDYYAWQDEMSAKAQEAFYKDTGICFAGPLKPGEKFRAKKNMKFGEVWNMTFIVDGQEKTTWTFDELIKDPNVKCPGMPATALK